MSWFSTARDVTRLVGRVDGLHERVKKLERDNTVPTDVGGHVRWEPVSARVAIAEIYAELNLIKQYLKVEKVTTPEVTKLEKVK